MGNRVNQASHPSTHPTSRQSSGGGISLTGAFMLAAVLVVLALVVLSSAS